MKGEISRGLVAETTHGLGGKTQAILLLNFKPPQISRSGLNAADLTMNTAIQHFSESSTVNSKTHKPSRTSSSTILSSKVSESLESLSSILIMLL